MRLQEFVNLIRPTRVDGPLTREAKGVAWDCRRVAPGNLFVVVPTPGRDTQAAVDMAVERGAAAVLCEGHEVVSLRATRLQVANTRALLPRVAELFYGQADRSLKLIAVVGSYGTSAPAAMVKSLLEATGLKCGLIGSAGCEVGERSMPALRKTVTPLDYHEIFAQMARVGCGACVVEFGPEAIEQKQLGPMAFDAVIFSNFDETPVLGRSAALADFCRSLEKGPKRCVGIFNVDSPTSAALFDQRIFRQQVSYGFDGGAEVRGSELDLGHRSLGMLVEAGALEVRLRTRLTGRKNASSLLAGFAAGLALRAPHSLIRFTLQKTAPPIGSLEPVGTAAELPIYVDSARTETEVAEALENLREISKGRVLLAVGSAGGESVERRFQLGHTAAVLAEYTVITTNNPGREAAAEIAAQVERGFMSGPHRPYHIELDRAQAIHDLIHFAQPGDTVLITGKGADTRQEFADTIVPFDDREHILEALETRATPAPAIVLPRPLITEPHELAATA